MAQQETDPRFGHDLAQVQDESGVALAILWQQLALSVEERLLRLKEQIQFAEELQGAKELQGVSSGSWTQNPS